MRTPALLAAPLALLVTLAGPVAAAPAAAAGVGTFYAVAEATGAVSRVTPTTGALTAIPPAGAAPANLSGMVLSSLGFGVGITYGAITEVYQVDAPGAEFAATATVTDSAAANVSECVGLGRDGADYVIACDTGTATPTVGRLDPTTWVYTPVITWTDGFPPISIATAANGTTVAMSLNGRLSIINLTSGTITYVPPPAVVMTNVMAIAFDVNQLYAIAVAIPSGALSVMVIDLTDAEAYAQSSLSNPAYLTNALAILPAAGVGAGAPDPTLAATGSDSGPLAAVLVLVLAGSLLLTGAILARGRPRSVGQ